MCVKAASVMRDVPFLMTMMSVRRAILSSRGQANAVIK